MAWLAAALVVIAFAAIGIEKRVRRGPLHAAWAETIASMRAAGEPLAPEDFGGGELDLVAWLRRLPDPEGSVDLGVRLIAPYVSARFGPAMRSTLLASTVSGDSLEAVLDRESWEDALDGPETAAELRALREELTASDHELEVLVPEARVDVARWAANAKDLDLAPVAAALVVSRRLALDVVLALPDHGVGTIERALARLVVLTRLCAEVPDLAMASVAKEVARLTRRAVENGAPLLDDATVAELEQGLAAVNLRAGLAGSVRMENVLLLQSPVLRDSLRIPPTARPEDFPAHVDFDALEDLLSEIAARREIAATLALPYADARVQLLTGSTSSVGFGHGTLRPVAASTRFVWLTTTSDLLRETHAEMLAQCAEVELEIAFARIRLRARAGVEEARALAATIADPYGAGPLGARVEADGTLAAWSVGPDGADGTADDERLPR